MPQPNWAKCILLCRTLIKYIFPSVKNYDQIYIPCWEKNIPEWDLRYYNLIKRPYIKLTSGGGRVVGVKLFFLLTTDCFLVVSSTVGFFLQQLQLKQKTVIQNFLQQSLEHFLPLKTVNFKIYISTRKWNG